MFGRVSTVDLGSYCNDNLGVFLGKQWQGGYQEIDSIKFQILDGWRTYVDDGSGNYVASYPEYSLPNNLPDFVNGSTNKENEYSYAKRFLIGDGTPALGPMSLDEALFVYSVVKKIDIEGSLYAPDGQSSDEKTNITTETVDENDPLYLFRSEYKNGQEMSFFGYVIDVDEEGNENFYEAGQEIRFSGPKLYIVIDVDNINDYYIVGFPIWWNDSPLDGGIYTFWSQIANGYPNKLESPIDQTFTYTFGDITTSHTYKVFYNYPLSFKATEFWPYKTASGQPVYDTSTGSIANSPLP